MYRGLFWLILVGSAVACAATETLVFLVAQPPDATAAFLGGLWMAMPYLLACGMAYFYRRHLPALTALAICFLLVALGGVSITASATAQQKQAERDVKNAVLPGEDPNSGPGAMRKSGAEFGAAIGFGVMILLGVFLPPIQSAVVVIPPVIVRLVSGRKASGEPMGTQPASEPDAG